MGFPFELVTMLGSTFLGGVVTLWGMHVKAKAANNAAMIQALNAQAQVVQAAREHGLKEPRFAVTRQIIALLAVVAIIVLPKIYPILMELLSISEYTPLTYGWTQWNPSWLPFLVEGKETLVWQEVKGLAITPLDTHLVSSIVGFYFGSAMVRH